MKLDIWAFFENLSRKFKFHENLTRITGTVHEDVCTFMIISHSVPLRMRNVSEKGVENINIWILSSIIFSPENSTLYEIMWKNKVEPGRPQMTK